MAKENKKKAERVDNGDANRVIPAPDSVELGEVSTASLRFRRFVDVFLSKRSKVFRDLADFDKKNG